MDDDPAEEDDDFEVDLDAVDVGSFAMAVVSSGFKVLASESMSVGKQLWVWGGATVQIHFCAFVVPFDGGRGGGMLCVI